MTTSRRSLLVALVAAITVAASARSSAHPVATTAVAIVANGTSQVRVEIASETSGLLAKLAALADRPSPGIDVNAADAQALVSSMGDVLTSHLDLRAGTRLVPLHLSSVKATPSNQITIALEGELPPGAPTVVWRSTLLYGSYALTVRRTGTSADSVEWLEGPQWSAPIVLRAAGPSSTLAGMLRTVGLGFTHIVPFGLDHILFVLGLFLLNRRLRPILIQVSTFTLAHSITLGLTLYGVVSLRTSIIEPLIALSIVYVACENLLTNRLTAWRIALVFAFGLLHGMGFAEALARLDLQRSQFMTTLVAFNVGVEGGQLAVIAAAAIAVRLIAVPAPRYHALVVRPASAMIALAGAFWVIQRVI